MNDVLSDRDTVTSSDLYAMVFSDDELKCNACEHYDKPCSNHVTHRVTSCQPEELVCFNATQAYLAGMADNWACEDCNEDAADCWKVVAI